MKKLFLLTTAAILAMLVLASGAMAQEGPACPARQVNVLQADGTFICVPESIEDQTPEQIEAVVNDPRSNAETPIVENQGVPNPGDLTPAQAEAAGIEQQVSCEGFISFAGNPSQFSAQQFYDFNATPTEQAILDPDGDGIACEGLVSGEAESAPAPAPTSTGTEAMPSESMTVMPDTGGPSLLLPVAVLLVGSGVLGFALLKRNQVRDT